MNNKGQSLVIFVLFLPIIFLLIAIIYDLGSFEINKQKNINEVKSIITYGLKNIDDDNLNQKLNTLLNKNIGTKASLSIDNNTIKINLNYKEKSIFPSIIKNSYQVNLTYKGYLDNENIIIIKE
ncbi:MAG: pilus assembly protein [Bacilli bacterium]|nr:pilus assembly protein [Bacilli bacterium]